MLCSRHGRADQAAVPAAVARAGRPRAGDVRPLPSTRRVLDVRRVRGAGPQRRDPRRGDAGPADRERARRRARHGRGGGPLRRRTAGSGQRATARRADSLPVLGAHRPGRGAARDRCGAVRAPALETVAGPARRLACRSSRYTPGSQSQSSRIRGPRTRRHRRPGNPPPPRALEPGAARALEPSARRRGTRRRPRTPRNLRKAGWTRDERCHRDDRETPPSRSGS